MCCMYSKAKPHYPADYVRCMPGGLTCAKNEGRNMNHAATLGRVELRIVAMTDLIPLAMTPRAMRTANAGVIERCGKLNRIVQPGLHALVPFCERVFVDLRCGRPSSG